MSAFLGSVDGMDGAVEGAKTLSIMTLSIITFSKAIKMWQSVQLALSQQ